METFHFSCPICSRQYQADEEHIGRSIRCTTPGCKEIITIAWQDGRYTTSNKQIKTENQRHPKGIDEIRKNEVMLGKTRLNRGIVFAGAALLLLGIGLGGYKLGKRAAPKSTAATFDWGTAVGLDDKPIGPTPSDSSTVGAIAPKTTQASDAQPISSKVDKGPKWLKSLDDGTIHYPAKPISARSPKTQNVGIQEIPLPANSLPTGTRLIADQATAGRGELEAINGTSLDACVIVVDSSTQERVRKVYIKSQDSFTLGHLNPGNYKVLFATGADWENTGEHFNRDASYFEFGKVLSFEEAGTSYEQHTITLHPVANGNVHARSISEAEFHALTGKR